MRSPRTIAKDTNDSSKFDPTVESYDAEAGAPAGTAKRMSTPDYAANPVNPPEPAAPVKNLRK